MLKRWRKPADTGALAPFRAPPPVRHPVPEWRAAALALPDGAPLGEALAAELHAEMRRRAEDVAGAWSPPRLSALHVRHDGAPWGWAASRNLFLVAPDSQLPFPTAGMAGFAAVDCVVAVGANVHLHQAQVGGDNALLAVGDGARLGYTSLCAGDGATVLLGEDTTSTFLASVDGRNGGRILVGADGMWANGARLITDDMHAIRDVATGRRLNRRGGSIVLEPHVWLGEQVMVMADSRVGRDTVVGAGSIVRGVALPANAVCAGRPLRALRTGTTWSREDLP